MSVDVSSTTAAPPPGGSLVQPLSAGLLAGLVGYASTFTIVLAGLRAAGASPAQAASGLLIVCVLQGVLSVAVSLLWRQPISIVWSTPGYALLIATGAQAGGFPVAVGAFLVTALLIVVAGVWRPFGRLVAAIPIGLASAMLAGVLFEICLAPVQAVHSQPTLVLPIVIAWALALRFARRFAIPIAVVVTAVVVIFATRIPAGALAGTWPALVPVMPAFAWGAVGSLAVPLFIVTMASQNVPGLTVLRANGYKPEVGAIFVVTGIGSAIHAFAGGGPMNLAAITAALCAGPEAHPDPAKRYWATVAAGLVYVVLGLFAAFAAAFIAASPPTIIQAVAGLALMGSFAGALAAALARPEERIAVAVTFVTAASGISVFGIGSSFWGLVAGGLVLALETFPRRS